MAAIDCVTYALLDPVMTVLRPVAAFITATVTGLLINLLPETRVAALDPDPPGESVAKLISEKPKVMQRIHTGLGYAFGELLKDIGGWLLIGVAVAGVIGYLVPDDFFTVLQGHNFLAMLVMLLVGIPLYICASASTPIGPTCSCRAMKLR